MSTQKIKAFKGFTKDFKCRDMQYEVGKEFTHDEKVEVCASGLHSCEYALDVLRYYEAATSRFAEVEASGDIERHSDDSKICSSHLKVNAEINIHTLIKAAIDFTFSRIKKSKEKVNEEDSACATNKLNSGAASNSGNSGAASNSGYSGAASNSGDRGAASNSGDSGAASNSGNNGAASNSGNSGAASNSGYRGAASNSGDRGAASNSGYRGAASNSGYRGAAFTVGSHSSAETNAKESVAVAVGYSNKVKGSLGSWLVIAERNEKLEIINIVSKKVDGKKVKADTWYQLHNSKLMEL